MTVKSKQHNIEKVSVHDSQQQRKSLYITVNSKQHNTEKGSVYGSQQQTTQYRAKHDSGVVLLLVK